MGAVVNMKHKKLLSLTSADVNEPRNNPGRKRRRKNPSYEISFDGGEPRLSEITEEQERPRAKGRSLFGRRNPPLSAFGPSYGYHGKQPPPESYLDDLLDTGRLRFSRYENKYSDRGAPQMVTELSIPNSETKLRYFETSSPYYQPEFIISNPLRTILRTKSSQQAASALRQLVDEEAMRTTRNRRLLGGAAVLGTIGLLWMNFRGSRTA